MVRREDPRTAALCTGHKRNGEPCRMIAVRGMTKCRLHGGRSVSGLAHYNFKHGRYSKHLPPEIAARVEEARRNPRLLSLEDDIAVAEARLATLLEAAQTGEAGVCWQELREARARFRQAAMAEDMAGMRAADATIDAVIARGAQAAETWEEIGKLWERRCKQVQTQVKTLQSLQQMVTVQQHVLAQGALMQAVLDAVQTHADKASGRKILMDIQAEFTRLSTVEER
jgi:hypothetical protein